MKVYIVKLGQQLLLTLGMLSFFGACTPKEKQTKALQDNPLFIGKVFVEQIDILKVANKGLYKKGSFDRKLSEDKIIPKDINWGKELKFFQNIDVSKPAWDGFLQFDTMQNDNTKIVKIKALKSDIPYREIKLIYSLQGKLLQVSGFIDNSNDYMVNQTKFEANFILQNEINILNTYHINGKQYFRNQDEISYFIDSKVQ